MKTFDCMAAMKALSEENRIRILRVLLDGERSVNDIAQALAMSQFNVSRHLKILCQAGLLDCKKQDTRRFYAVAEEIRSRLRTEGMILDLGCCQFDFQQMPK